MTNLFQRSEISLRSFYIFNSDFGAKEGNEHKKVLFYYPKDIEDETKIKDVGLSEAIIAFTGTFADTHCCKSLHTLKTTQVFYQPEKNYWMVLVLNVPKEVRTKDGNEVVEYRGVEVSDRIYQSMLEQCYYMFRFCTGTFNMNLDIGGAINTEASREQLQQQLSLFYDKYISSLRPPVCDVLNYMRSLQYLPLNKFLFLRTHNFVQMICATFPSIKDAVCLYNDQVVCSGKLEPSDLYSLHEYITDVLMPSETTGVILTRSNSTVSEAFQNGGFILGPEHGAGSAQPIKVYLKKDNAIALQAYRLIVYRALNATLCLFVNAEEELGNDFFTELHACLGPQLTSIAQDIGETFNKQHTSTSVAGINAAPNQTDCNAKFLFIDESSLKHLSNMPPGRRKTNASAPIPMNVMSLIADLYSGNPSDTSTALFDEVQMKTTNDFWIVSRRCNWRQYYVIICNSKSTLLDVTNEAKRVFEQELSEDIFFEN